AINDQQKRQFAATEHYYDYEMSDGVGQIDGRRGIRLSESGVQVLDVFQRQQPKGAQEMSTADTKAPQALTTKPGKTRGTLTTKPGTFDQAIALMQARNMRKHDEIVLDLLANDATYQQMDALLQPLGQELHTETPVAILQALIAAYRNG